MYRAPRRRHSRRLKPLLTMNLNSRSRYNWRKYPGNVTCSCNSSGWCVYFPTERDGKPVRARKRFPSRVTAHQFALQKAEEITQHGTAYGTLPNEVHTAYRLYREQVTLLAKGGKETPSFEMLVRGALTSLATEIIPGESAVADRIESYLASRKADLSVTTYANLRAPLHLFARSLGDRAMRSITPEMIERWLSDLPRQRSTKEQEPKQDPKHSHPTGRLSLERKSGLVLS